VKTYGIYLAYPPVVDLRAEGLGRLLAEFLKAANQRGDIRFVIACPSWSRKSLCELFDEANIPAKAFEIIGPETKPVLLRLYEGYEIRKQRKRRKGPSRLFARLKAISTGIMVRVERVLVTTRSGLILALVMFLALPFLAAGVALYATWRGLNLLVALFVKTWSLRLRQGRFWRTISRMMTKLLGTSMKWRLFRFMEDAEANLISDYVNLREDVQAWYSPTAFWPHFNRISMPRLICVPDIVLTNFPVSFSTVGGSSFLETFTSVGKTIEGGDHFVTYSDDVKYRTLVDRYLVNPGAVSVVRHGVNRLDELIAISGSPDNDLATGAFCSNLLRGALHKAIGNPGAINHYNSDARFIFYASQFRPNKNVISLLRAYEYLLKRRYIGCKLVLTGNPKDLPEIAKFITEHNLQNDVLCLHGLSARELAACYRLADLAVNPSLSEGGCPFTLTEALSVGTPVVMARIAVTEEVVTDSDLQDLMLFDPFDWEAIANKIEWALQNRDMLLERQLKLYEKLAERTWQNVVDEHVAILDRISTQPAQIERRA
jgi:glycosyltransferase involved in cell wall biosynthesis